jgi:hypothetical protein
VTPKTSPKSWDFLGKLLGPRGRDLVAYASQDKILRESVVTGEGADGMMSIPKFIGNVDKYKPALLEKIYGDQYPAFREVIDRMRDLNRMYRAGLNASQTQTQGAAGMQAIGVAKIAAAATLGIFGGPHLGLNPILAAVTGATLPYGLAKLWFNPKMLPFVMKGLQWSPTQKNAAKMASWLTTRMTATLATEMANQKGQDVKIEGDEPARGRGGQSVRIE